MFPKHFAAATKKDLKLCFRHNIIVPALLNCGGADTLRPPPTADFGDVPGVVAFLRGLLPFSVIKRRTLIFLQTVAFGLLVTITLWKTVTMGG